MNRATFLHFGALLVAMTLAGCGGSGSSTDTAVVGDGRSVVLALDESTSLGDNTYFAVRRFQDNRQATDAGYVAPSIITLTGLFSRRNSTAPAESFTLNYQKDEYIKSNATGITYRFQ